MTIVAALTKGKGATVKASPKKGRGTTDTYALSGFSATAGLAAAEQLHADGVLPFNLARLLPKPLRFLATGASSALLGSYTGVLVSATAIPVWFSGRRFLPAIFVCSATSTACALQLALLALTPGSHVATMRKL